jgi:thioredoxin 1
MSKSAGLTVTTVVLLAAGAIIVFKNRNASTEAARDPSAEATSLAALPSTRPGATEGARLPRVVDLGADKCQACKELAPILESLRKECAGRAQVDFIDVWKNPEAAEEYGIQMIPTQIFYDAQGREIWRHVGFLPREEFVAKLRAAGMQ